MTNNYGKNWHDVFIYDEKSPSGIVWKETMFCGKNYAVISRQALSMAGGVNTDGYWQTYTSAFGSKSRSYLVHRIVYEMFNGPVDWKPGIIIDHLDGNPLNNKIENLRLATPKENNRNHRKNLCNTSGSTGVSKEVFTMKDGTESLFWRASVFGLDGKRLRKAFSVRKHGDEAAFKMACEFRSKQLELLNAEGAGYTQRHGD